MKHALVAALCLSAVLREDCWAQNENPGSSVSHNTPSLFIVADPQIHNVYGSGIKQMLRMADLLTGVAQRPPELNLLAPYVLEDFVQRGVNAQAGQSSKLILFLGDATNVGCSGEFRRFQQASELRLTTQGKKGDHITLMSHGNHDSYFMGTVNSYIPADTTRPVPRISTLTGVMQGNLPADEQWWGGQHPPCGGKSNWKDACYEPKKPIPPQPDSTGNDPSNASEALTKPSQQCPLTQNDKDDVSSPMNKLRWIKKYLDMLGVQLTPQLPPHAPVVSVDETPQEPLALKRIKFTIKGQLVRPIWRASIKTSSLQETSLSFIVQSAVFNGTHKLIIIDTSVCANARGGLLDFLKTNAGTHGCMGRAQLDIIEEMVRDDMDGLPFIFAGHFPLKDVVKADRDRFIEIMKTTGAPWTYLSAHTHDPQSSTGYASGREINVGSTTDWPMEINRIHLRRNDNQPTGVSTWRMQTDPSITYIPPEPYEGSEVCRHLDAAEKLAAMNINDGITTWASPATMRDYRNCECAAREQFSNRKSDRCGNRSRTSPDQLLLLAEERIKERMQTSGYREAVRGIAAAASRFESTQTVAPKIK